ncbi:ferrochelatase [Kineosporia babensis]|uniref:Coproporphyrin III ferrochelatase n=1 Tax=Kineosporia babensis TaxID=499548 RepID=A0A9X1NHL9_9ACTN|nr:ferrochelatase [Kineosporia babensis]
MSSLKPYDAVLLLSFGGPEAPDEVMPFLENVTRGRGIPRERLEEVEVHYQHFGGRSPINDENRLLLANLREQLDLAGVGDVPVYWGNRNWAPFTTDVLREAHEAGARRVLTVVTSAYPSYSGCRQYREDLAEALITLSREGRSLRIDKIRHYFDQDGFLQPIADSVAAALQSLPDGSRVVFVTHSIPDVMDDASGPLGNAYTQTHREACAAVAERVGTVPEWDLVYCSRSGPPSQPWLEPDIGDHLAELKAKGVPGVVVVPIGFVSDHMEVVFDLDTEAEEIAQGLDLPFVRAATSGRAPAFAASLARLVVERAAAERGENPQRPSEAGAGAWHDVCPATCCTNLRNPDKPAACGVDWVLPIDKSAEASAAPVGEAAR